MLECAQPRFFDRFGGVVVMVAVLALYGTAQNRGLEWMSWWGYWAIMGVSSWFMYLTGDRWTAAGASWVQKQNSWVDTYHLTRIRVYVGRDIRSLSFGDTHGNELRSLSLAQIQANPDLWDLVYNGILHSVASGNCDIDAKTRQILKIPYELGPRPVRYVPRRGRVAPVTDRRTRRPVNFVPRTDLHLPG